MTALHQKPPIIDLIDRTTRKANADYTDRLRPSSNILVLGHRQLA